MTFHVKPAAREETRQASAVSREKKKRLDRPIDRGEDVLLDRLGHTMIMRGRWKRNRAPREPEDESPASATSQSAAGEDQTETAEEDPQDPAPTSPPARTVQPHSSDELPPLRTLLSEVATAHAELDDVLPPPTPTVDDLQMTPVLRRRAHLAVEQAKAAADESPAEQAPVGVASTADEAPATPPPAPSAPEEPEGERSAPVDPADSQLPAATVTAPPDRPQSSPPADAATTGSRSDESDLVRGEPRQAVAGGTASAEQGTPEQQAAAGNPLPRVLAVANQKGGVGKTTTSVNLGAALAELGLRVLVIDLDPQGNATTGLGVEARTFELSMYDVLMRDASMEDCIEPTSIKNLFLAPATIDLAGAEIELVPAFSRELKLRRALDAVRDDFDFVLIDCPPSLGLLTVNALAAASEVLVPIQCEYYALEGLSQLQRNVHLVSTSLNPTLDISTIVLTMYDARTKLADEVAVEVRQHFGSKVCRIVIPRTVRLSEAPSFGQPITVFDPASRGSVAYRELAQEVSGGTS